jgi:hypothetical protein
MFATRLQSPLSAWSATCRLFVFQSTYLATTADTARDGLICIHRAVCMCVSCTYCGCCAFREFRRHFSKRGGAQNCASLEQQLGRSGSLFWGNLYACHIVGRGCLLAAIHQRALEGGLFRKWQISGEREMNNGFVVKAEWKMNF